MLRCVVLCCAALRCFVMLCVVRVRMSVFKHAALCCVIVIAAVLLYACRYVA